MRSPRKTSRKVLILDHPVLHHHLAVLRKRTTANHAFRETLRRISAVMAVEVTRSLRHELRTVRTPLTHARGVALAEDIVLVPVLRAGLGLLDGFLDILPDARVGHIGLYRNEATLEPVAYYAKLPPKIGKSLVLLLDPMLATGGSSEAAITFLKRQGARRIVLVTVVTAPAGLRRVRASHPDVPIVTAVLDAGLNARGYILPGLGDAGDRLFGT